MKKLLFVDHSFHKKTRSSDFFIEIVRQRFEVDLWYLTPDEPANASVLEAAAAADIVLVWQMDFLAPAFRALGKPTIVIPMYDGSGGLPALHWLFAGGARFFNFCWLLNERIRLLGGETMGLRYFPPPVSENELPRFDHLRAFFWQRRPDHGVHFNYIEPIFGRELDSFHLHNVPDVAGYFRAIVPPDATYDFTESTWFERKSDYEACLKSSNVFFAPRASEGIGLALLEAMARGMLVIANDAPTNNEYVSNGINGILFNKDVKHEPLHLRHIAAQLGRTAWLTVVEGHEKWLASSPAIFDWIDTAPASAPVRIDLATFFRDLWYSFYGSSAEYEGFLRRHLGLLQRLSHLPEPKLIDLIGGSPEIPRAETSQRYRLGANGVLDLLSPSDRHIGSGWSGSEGEWRWALGKKAELYFSGLAPTSPRLRAVFEAASLPELGKWVLCTIKLNDKQVFRGRIRPDWKEHSFSFDRDLLKSENQLTLQFGKARSIATDPRQLSVRFKSFRFSPETSASPIDRESGKSAAVKAMYSTLWSRLINRGQGKLPQ